MQRQEGGKNMACAPGAWQETVGRGKMALEYKELGHLS